MECYTQFTAVSFFSFSFFLHKLKRHIDATFLSVVKDIELKSIIGVANFMSFVDSVFVIHNLISEDEFSKSKK